MIHHQIEKKKKKTVEKNSKTHLSQKHTHTLPEILIYCFNQNTNPTRPISRNIMSAYGVTLSLILLLCLANEVNYSEAHINGSETEMMVPMVESGRMEKMMTVMNDSRRRLGSFQICALCTCCGGAKGLCLPSPCCYAINCNIPNRPFGFCSFTPKTCNCFGCHL